MKNLTEILRKVYEQKINIENAEEKVLRLFNVSGTSASDVAVCVCKFTTRFDTEIQNNKCWDCNKPLKQTDR